VADAPWCSTSAHPIKSDFITGQTVRHVPFISRPPAVTIEMAKGFPLYMLKAVVSSRGDEVIDLARSNLWP
jgi:hypothetical protein